jgi:citrate synthase
MNDKIDILCKDIEQNSKIAPGLYEKYGVKRGLRNSDGSGVTVGLTNICNVHGYVMDEGEKKPIEGELFYRGINITDITANTTDKNRFGYEETAFLILFGDLPTTEELETFRSLLAFNRTLPSGFSEDIIFKAPSRNIMNKMARAVLALYAYDSDPEDMSLKLELNRAMAIIARLSSIMVDAYQIKKRYIDNESLFMHPQYPDETDAQANLSTMRPDRQYSDEEALLLDLCLILHAEHGGGNNSTFVCRCLTSSGTDAYSAYSGAIGSLKGPLHGGANIKVMAQLENFKANLPVNFTDADVSSYLEKVFKKEAGDGSGKIYGMGHAVYTKSDPRAVVLKKHALSLAKGLDIENDFRLLDAIERLTPEIFDKSGHTAKTLCANVDMYSGLVYQMLKIPPELNTALFAVSRMPGWAAHRIEEKLTGKRIMRPGYKTVAQLRDYVNINDRAGNPPCSNATYC